MYSAWLNEKQEQGSECFCRLIPEKIPLVILQLWMENGFVRVSRLVFVNVNSVNKITRQQINKKKIIKIFWKIWTKNLVNLWIVIVGNKEQCSKKRRRKLSSLLIRFALTKENAFIWQIHLFIYYHYYRRYHHLLFSSSRKFTSDILVAYILWCRNKIFKFWVKI